MKTKEQILKPIYKEQIDELIKEIERVDKLIKQITYRRKYLKEHQKYNAERLLIMMYDYNNNIW